MKQLLLLFLLVYTSSAQAQSLSWLNADTCTSMSSNRGVKIINGDIYTQVGCNDPMTYSNGSFSSPANSIVRMSANGDYKMSYGQFEYLDNYTADDHGNVYVVGFDSLLDNTYYSCCKYDSAGNLAWNFPIGTSYGLHVRHSLLTTDGFVFAGDWTNYAGPWAGSFNLFIAKVDFQGNLKFLHKFDNHDQGSIHKIILQEGNVLLSGYLGASLTVKDSVSSITLSGHQSYLAQFSSDGHLLSAATLPRRACPYSLTQGPSGTVYFGSWDTIGLYLFHYTHTGLLLSREKIAEAGSTSGIEDIKIDPAGNFYFSVSFRDSLDLGAGQIFHTTAYGDPDWVMFRRNPWNYNDWSFSPPGYQVYGEFDLFAECDLALHLFYRDSIDVFGSQYYGSAGNIMARMNCGLVTSQPESAEEPFVMNIYPNPGSGSFNANFGSDIHGSIRVYDLMGHCFLQKQCSQGSDFLIDLQGKAKGVYFAEVFCDKGRIVKKVIVQ